MESLRDKLNRYLEIKLKIDPAANEVMNGNQTIESAKQKYHIDVDKVHKDLSKMYTKKIKILKAKKIYFDNKRKMLEVLQYLSKTEGATPDHIDPITVPVNDNISDEYEKYIKSPESYTYDKSTLDGENKIGVFTFVEEDLLLQKLCNFNKIILNYKIERGCHCWYCALERLSLIAYKFALQKNKILPESWDDVHKKVDENWLYEFEMRHTEELSENFDLECLWESPSLSISYTEVTLSIFDIQLQRGSDSSNISDIAMRSYRRKNLKINLSKWKRIDSAVTEVLVGKREQEVVACEFRGQDKTYFEMKIDMIEKENQYIKEKEGFEKTFQTFLPIRERLLEIGITEENQYIYKIAGDIKIDGNLAVIEYHKYKESILANNYKYDKIINDISTDLLVKNVYFTYNEEYDLLKQLCSKKEEKLELCKCQTCASELIITLAEEYNQNKRVYSNLWVNEEDKLIWLYLFIMRHGNTIFKTFPEDDCEIDTVLEMVRSELQSSSPYIEKKSKSPSTSRSPLKKQSELKKQIFTIETIKKYMDGRNTLNLFARNKRLHQAAEDILAQRDEMTKENYEAIIKKYKLDSKDVKLINEKINILYKENKYFETKDKVEKALEAISNGMSEDKAAKEFKIDMKIINEELGKFNQLKSKNIKYEYDEPTSDDNAIFTFIQEFSFLKTLISEKRKKPFDCWCYPCSMTFLYNIAFMELVEKENFTYPPIWENVEAREMWWLEFYRRHSKRIFEIFLPSCTNPNVLKYLSLPSEEETSGPSPKKRRTE